MKQLKPLESLEFHSTYLLIDGNKCNVRYVLGGNEGILIIVNDWKRHFPKNSIFENENSFTISQTNPLYLPALKSGLEFQIKALNRNIYKAERSGGIIPPRISDQQKALLDENQKQLDALGEIKQPTLDDIRLAEKLFSERKLNEEKYFENDTTPEEKRIENIISYARHKGYLIDANGKGLFDYKEPDEIGGVIPLDQKDDFRIKVAIQSTADTRNVQEEFFASFTWNDNVPQVHNKYRIVSIQNDCIRPVDTNVFGTLQEAINYVEANKDVYNLISYNSLILDVKQDIPEDLVEEFKEAEERIEERRRTRLAF